MTGQRGHRRWSGSQPCPPSRAIRWDRSKWRDRDLANRHAFCILACQASGTRSCPVLNCRAQGLICFWRQRDCPASGGEKVHFVNKAPSVIPSSIDKTLDLLASADYLADRSLATVLFLALRMGRPLFLEGEAGVGKTEIAKVLSTTLGRRLIRLQCYEGLDVAAAVYEWNYAAQMIAIRLAEAEGAVDRERLTHDVFSEQYLIKRPLLQALEPDAAGAPVLLIDELDRADEAFEAFLLEVLADFQVTIPELGTVRAAQPPIVVITSNRTREIHDALKRRCLYHWVGYPSAERELKILRAKVPGIA